MRMPSEKDWEDALDLIDRLQKQLSQADSSGSGVNGALIQKAVDLLERYGGGGPKFE